MIIAPRSFIPAADSLILRMRERADLSQERAMPRGPERRAAVWDDLVATSTASQAPVLPVLDGLKAQGAIDGYRTMSLPNAVIVDIASGQEAAVREALAGIGNIEQVQENKLFAAPRRSAAAAVAAPSGTAQAGWHLEQIGAVEAQAAGWDGSGITVGVADTGLDIDTEAVRGAYRGFDAASGTTSHDYNWFDPVEGAAAPVDRNGHGTTVSGFVAGSDSSHVTGVAPKSRIIATTVGGADGSNTTALALQGLQFLLAPTKVDGSAPDARRGADVVNLSWGDRDQGDTSVLESIEGLQAAGIVVVAGAGNDGMAGSMLAPAVFPGVISVASTNPADRVSDFSSRGTPDDASKPRPIIAAPGEDVVGVHQGNEYFPTQGTSFSSPIVAGTVAAMLQAVPNASDEQIQLALTSTATDVADPGADYESGAGRLNVKAAVDKLIELAGPAARSTAAA